MKKISRCAYFIVCAAMLMAMTPQTLGVSSQVSSVLSEATITGNLSVGDAQINQLDSVSSFERFQSTTSNLTDDVAIQGMVISLLIGKIQVEDSYMDIPLEQMLNGQVLSVEGQDTAVSANTMLPSANQESDSLKSGAPTVLLPNDNLLFFIQKAQLFGNMRKDAGIIITDENLDYDFSTISYSGNSASVNVTEHYSFQINTIDVRSYVDTDYHIVLEKNIAGQWEIVEVTSNDWFDQAMDYEPFDVAELLNHMDNVNTADVETNDQEIFSSEPAAATATSQIDLDYTINASRVANYAATFWKNYNSSYKNYNGSGGDCMNYASQCLAAGLGFTSDGSALCDNIGSYIWKPNSSSFISCSSFRTYLSNNTSETGLFGTVTTTASANSTYKVGDIIHVDGTGGPYTHAAIVTSAGDKNTALVSAHNNNRIDVTVSFMWNASADIKVCSFTGFKTYSTCSGHTYTTISNSSDGLDSVCNKCGYSRLRILANTIPPISKGTTRTISASTTTRCYRIAVGITSPSGTTTWLPYAMSSSTFSGSYTFSESGLYTIVVAARDINDSLAGSIGTNVTYYVRVT